MKKIPLFSGRSAGFTLVELLIVMAILAVISAIGFGSFQSSQLKGRDSKRKAELKSIGVALEAYYNDHQKYPLGSAGKIAGCGAETACNWGGEFSDDKGTVYMVTLPSDPRSAANYYYDSDGLSYQLYARLENNLDASVPTDNQGKPAVYTGLSCGEETCNYGVASSNTLVTTGRTITAE